MFVGPRVGMAIKCCHGHREAQNAKRPNDHRAETLHGGRACARPPAESARLPWKHETSGHGRHLTALCVTSGCAATTARPTNNELVAKGERPEANKKFMWRHEARRTTEAACAHQRCLRIRKQTKVYHKPPRPRYPTHTLSIGTAIAECSALAASANYPWTVRTALEQHIALKHTHDQSTCHVCFCCFGRKRPYSKRCVR